MKKETCSAESVPATSGHGLPGGAVLSGGPHLDAELEICGSVVEFPARDDGEDVAVLQVGQQLQVSRLLLWGGWGGRVSDSDDS